MVAGTRKGFTIVELLVVVTIISILMSLLFPAVNSGLAFARRLQCIQHQQQLGKAVIAYASDKDRMPPTRAFITRPGKRDFWTWVHYLFPYIEQNDLYDRINRGSAARLKVKLPILICPSDPPQGEEAPLSYVANSGIFGSRDLPANGAFSDFSDRRNSFETTLAFISKHDGTTQTFMLSENVDATEYYVTDEAAVGMVWPMSIRFNEDMGGGSNAAHARPSSRHPGGFVATFCDGRTKFLSEDIVPDVYNLLMTSYGRGATPPQNEVLDEDMLNP